MKIQSSSLFAIILIILLSFIQYGCPEPGPEEDPPIVEIISPDDAEFIIIGTQVTIKVNAHDGTGSVNSLYIGIDDDDVTHFGPGYGPDYFYDWNTSEVSLGEHRIYARGVDSDGISATDEIHVEIYEGNAAPVAIFTVDPTSGTTLTSFNFDANGSYDNEDPSDILQVRWDLEGDGSWDTEYSTEKTLSHQYPQAGDNNVRLEVKDSGELTDIDSIYLVVDTLGWNPGEPCPDVPQFSYEGQVYNPILIGDQCWLKENMNVGIMINGNDDMSDNGTIEKYCYGNVPAYCDMYGGLYQWDEMMQYVTTNGAQGICPPGWHIPTDEEWKQLEGTVDDTYGYPDPQWDNIELRGYNCGFKLKTTGGWSGDGNGSDLFGFSARPGGHRTANGYHYILESAAFWTSTEAVSNNAWFRQFLHTSDKIWRNYTVDFAGFSVRCIKDQ